MRGFLRITGSTLRGCLLLRSSLAAAVEPSRLSPMFVCARRPFVWVELACGGPDLFWWVVAVMSLFSASVSPPCVGKFGVT
ncbi:hypothetical protein QL285_066118 [Trifolium repens]|nr:hypothetical protein QL285_066118 [Trifolium repens]